MLRTSVQHCLSSTSVSRYLATNTHGVGWSIKSIHNSLSQSIHIPTPVTPTPSVHKTLTTRTQRHDPVGNQPNAPHPTSPLLTKTPPCTPPSSNLYRPILRMKVQLERAVIYKYHILAPTPNPPFLLQYKERCYRRP